MFEDMLDSSEDQIMVAPKGKGFTVFRGDTARLENGKIRGTLYDIGKSLRPSIVRSWTTSYDKAKEFACIYAKDNEPNIVPIIYHGVSHKLMKGLFWDHPEREVYILRDKSILKNIEIIDRKDCDKVIK